MGCASDKIYREPPIVPTKTAIIHGFDHTLSAANWHNGKVTTVDGKNVIYSMFIIDDYSYNISLIPGAHRFEIKTTFNQVPTFFSTEGPYEATASVQAMIVAGHNYTLNGTIEGSTVKLWVENSSGKAVSDVVTTAYKKSKASLVS